MPPARYAAERWPEDMMAGAAVRGAIDAAPYYFRWGVVHISLANFLIIALMIVVFVLAIVVPFPRPRDDDSDQAERDDHR